MGFDEIMPLIKSWGESSDGIEAIILVGSYARGTNKPASDIDLCIITEQKSRLIKNPGFIRIFGVPECVTTERYGALTSIRVHYAGGPEVEFGIVKPSWISLPLDGGTRQVLEDGYQVIIDKHDLFSDDRIPSQIVRS